MAKFGKLLLGLGVVLLSAAGQEAQADPVTYTFSYERDPILTQYTMSSFTFSFTLPDYVTETGMFALPTPVTVHGHTITHAGTRLRTYDWVFGNGVGEYVAENTIGLGYDTLAFAFLFLGAPEFRYITSPTVLTQFYVQGLTSYLTPPGIGIYGSGRLEVTQAAPVPEPGTWLLVGSGAAALLRRRARRARSATSTI